MVKGRRFMSSNVLKVRCFLNVVGPNGRVVFFYDLRRLFFGMNAWTQDAEL